MPCCADMYLPSLGILPKHLFLKVQYECTNGGLCIRVTSDKCQSHWATRCWQMSRWFDDNSKYIPCLASHQTFISRNLKEVKINMNISFVEKSKCSALVYFVNPLFATLGPHFVFTQNFKLRSYSKFLRMLYKWEVWLLCCNEKYMNHIFWEKFTSESYVSSRRLLASTEAFHIFTHFLINALSGVFNVIMRHPFFALIPMPSTTQQLPWIATESSMQSKQLMQ